ncbi:hypothetical protein RRG08_037855 [Elysia crispata]|uniref:Uncharacterized protein n=1 Tax=Elysia crispata TaxID=231223 RepID=A0AAE0ZK86_9GAST|nr:hypothetical protein RRG08_037855 [Elysia crispata]
MPGLETPLDKWCSELFYVEETGEFLPKRAAINHRYQQHSSPSVYQRIDFRPKINRRRLYRLIHFLAHAFTSVHKIVPKSARESARGDMVGKGSDSGEMISTSAERNMNLKHLGSESRNWFDEHDTRHDVTGWPRDYTFHSRQIAPRYKYMIGSRRRPRGLQNEAGDLIESGMSYLSYLKTSVQPRRCEYTTPDSFAPSSCRQNTWSSSSHIFSARESGKSKKILTPGTVLFYCGSQDDRDPEAKRLHLFLKRHRTCDHQTVFNMETSFFDAAPNSGNSKRSMLMTVKHTGALEVGASRSSFPPHQRFGEGWTNKQNHRGLLIPESTRGQSQENNVTVTFLRGEYKLFCETVTLQA